MDPPLWDNPVFMRKFADMRRLFITDMDGTLLDNNAKVNPQSAAIISELTGEGALITVATARTPATVEPLLHDTHTKLPAIVLTGAAMWDREKKQYFNVRTIPADTPAWLLEAFEQHGVSPFVYTLDSPGLLNVYHTRKLTPQENNFYIDRAHLRLKRFCFLPSLDIKLMQGAPILMLGIAPMKNIDYLKATLECNDTISVSSYPDLFNSSIGYIEVFGKGVSKASAISKLKEMTGADSLTVYGDNLNDIPMMRIADDSVAVGNALQAVKDVASRVIGNNFSSAVALDMRAKFHENI